MKNGAWKKLRSSRGATMLMALLLMLVGLMVSAVIISAAVSTVAGVRSGEEQQQAYLTVESAAQLFRDTLEGSGQKYEIKTVKKYSDSTLVYEVGFYDQEITSPSGPFSAVIKDALDNVIHERPVTFKQSYEVTVDEAYEPVTLDVTVEPVYQGTSMVGCSIQADFYTSPDSGKGMCRMTLTADADLSVITQNYSTQCEKHIQRSVIWGDATLETPKTAVTGGNG